MTGRLPAGLEVSALIRQVNAAGGFATLLAKGEPQAGTILVVIAHNGADFRAFERMPEVDGARPWTLARKADPAHPGEFAAWLERRQQQDADLWIVELDIAQGERFIGLPDVY